MKWWGRRPLSACRGRRVRSVFPASGNRKKKGKRNQSLLGVGRGQAQFKRDVMRVSDLAVDSLLHGASRGLSSPSVS